MTKYSDFLEQFFNFFLKILIPAIVGIALKIAMTMEKEKITFFKVVLSFVSGIILVYLMHYPVILFINEVWQPLVISLVAMSGEYIGRLLINRFNIDYIIKQIIKSFVELISNILGMGRVFKNLLSTLIGGGLVFAGVYLEFTDWVRVFLVMVGIVLIFSKDTLFTRLGNMLDTAIGFFKK